MTVLIDGYYAAANRRGMARFCRNAANAISAKIIWPGKLMLIPFPVWEQIILPFIINRTNPDVVVFPYNTSPILNLTALRIQVIHDTIFYDNLRNITFYGLFSKTSLASVYRHLVCKFTAKKADLILTVSEHSRKKIAHTYGVDPSRISVIYNTLSEEFESNALKVEKRSRFNYVVLFVSGDAESKNLRFALDGLNAFSREYNIKIRANIVGVTARKHRELIGKLKYIETRLHVNIHDEALTELYSQSDCLIVPSLEEGFSIPIIEALATETPVISSGASCLPEILGDVGIYFDPRSTKDYVRALSEFYFSGNELYGRNLRERYRENFARNIVNSQLSKILSVIK